MGKPFEPVYTVNDDFLPIQGGQSKVFSAFRKSDGLHCAIKEIEIDSAIGRHIFEREIEVLTSFKERNIIELYDSYQDEKNVYLIMPWLEDNILEHLVNNKVSDSRIILNKYIYPIVSVIAKLHENGVTHRDISAKNILIQNHEPKLTDFGASWNHAKALESSGSHIYSIGYTPAKFGTGYQKDIYSLGVLSLELLSGKRLIEREKALDALRNLQIDSKYREIIANCIAEEPDNRYDNAIILKQKLSEVNRENRISIQNNGDYAFDIVLTNNARNGLKNLSRKTSNLEKDLELHIRNSLQHISPTYSDDGDIAEDRFWLVLDSVQLLLTAKEQESGWLAVAAHFQDSSTLEPKRRNKSTKDISEWVIQWGVKKNFEVQKKNRNGFAYFNARFLDWIKVGTQIDLNNQNNLDASTYLENLLQVIEAQIELNKNGFDELVYEESIVNNRILTIKLMDEPTMDLTGTFWKIDTRPPVYGEVDFQSGRELVILLNKAPLTFIPQKGKIASQISFGSEVSLKRQKDAINAMNEGTAPGYKLASYLADPSKIPPNGEAYIDRWFNKDLDDAKKNATRLVMASNSVTVVQGPPGTGKTTLISEIVQQQLSMNPKSQILIVSQTHVAIDNVLNRLSVAKVPGIVRLANPDSERISQASRKYLLDSLMRNWVRELESNARKFILEQATRMGLTEKNALRILELRKLRTLIDQLLVHIKDIEKDFLEKDRSYSLKDGKNSNVISQIVEESSEIDDDLIETYKKRIEIALPNCFEKEIVYDGNNHEAIKNLVEIELEILTQNRNLDEHFLNLLQAQTDWLLRVGSSEQIANLFLQTSRVLTGTCIGFLGHPAVRDLNFDLCILDEASQATLPVALVPMSKSKKWVIVGDSKQLGAYEGDIPRTFNQDEEFGVTKEQLVETFFSKFDSNLSESNKILLDSQYRMVDDIGRMISDIFYEGRIKSKGPTDFDFLKDFGLSSITWLETKDFSPDLKLERNAHFGGDSISNRAEMESIRMFITDILPFVDKIYESRRVSTSTPVSILVITPYMHQVEILRTALSEFSDLSYLTIEILTIDSVQGRESDIAIFSTVRNNTLGKTGFINDQRLNVAMSRGRYLLAIAGDSDFWQQTNSKLNQLIERFELYNVKRKDYSRATR